MEKDGKKKAGKKDKEAKIPELRVSHMGLGFLGSHVSMATDRIERAGYTDPRESRTGLMYLRRRGKISLPVELVDTGYARQEETPSIGWDYSTEGQRFNIKTLDPATHGEVLCKIFGFKEENGVFSRGGISIALIQDFQPAKWHLALYRQKGVEAREGFVGLCSKHISTSGDIAAKISDAFISISRELPANGTFSFEVPGLAGFSIEILFGSTSLRAHALDSAKVAGIFEDVGWWVER